MVSKAAVIAIVAILAVPILLGYALNLEETTETEYGVTGEAVNVTQLLTNGTENNYVHADVNQLNTKFQTSWSMPIYPQYQTISSAKSSLPMEQFVFGSGVHPLSRDPLSLWDYYYLQLNYSYSDAGNVTLTIYKPDNTIDLTVNKIHTFFWDKMSGTVSYTYYHSGGIGRGTYTPPDPDTYEYQFTSVSYTGTGYLERYNSVRTTSVDFSAGYVFNGSPAFWRIVTPNSNTKNILITINLDSVTDPNYSFDLGRDWVDYIRLTKTTVGSNVSWEATKYYNSTAMDTQDLYYDPLRSDNTYQFLLEVSENQYYPEALTPYYSVTYNAQLRYVGGWPTIIGEANYYQTYSFDTWTRSNTSPIYLDGVQIRTNGAATVTPILRVDDSLFVGFEYPVIENRSYDPAAFKTNPSTTINNVIKYGSSLQFGGNTYTVSDGKITLSGHKIPVNGLVLSSIPNDLGTYDNKIGNTVISTTATPSTIIFDGKWSASISTLAMESKTVTKTEWKAGDFAWDGIDHNFIMAGLLASLGAFVGVGIYARRTKSSVWPLLIVCGGAALLFFVML